MTAICGDEGQPCSRAWPSRAPTVLFPSPAARMYCLESHNHGADHCLYPSCSQVPAELVILNNSFFFFSAGTVEERLVLRAERKLFLDMIVNRTRRHTEREQREAAAAASN